MAVNSSHLYSRGGGVIPSSNLCQMMAPQQTIMCVLSCSDKDTHMAAPINKKKLVWEFYD